MKDSDLVRIITLDPAHYHAALVQRVMLPGVSKRAAVYAPLGPDVLAHLKLIESFNNRPQSPTLWELDVHCTSRSLDEMIAAKPGNVVVLAGRNRTKIDKIKASLEADLNLLSDKPWIIRSEDFPALEAALLLADRRGLVAYDIMTERYEITTILQRELVNDPDIFGTLASGDRENPSVFMESTHHILKTVAGLPSPRPSFFFDILDQGEGLTDVGTHLVDLVQWTLLPDQSIEYRHEIDVQAGKRWATPVRLEQFRQVTGAANFPAGLVPYVHDGRLDYFCNNQIDYKIRNAQVRLRALWNWESPAGVDFHHAIYRGTHASVEVTQTAEEKYEPELFVWENRRPPQVDVLPALRARIEHLQQTYPGVGYELAKDGFHITIPDRYRVRHEAHFSQVLDQFLKYLKAPQSMPVWERANMLAKYYVTTAGVQLSHAS